MTVLLATYLVGAALSFTTLTLLTAVEAQRYPQWDPRIDFVRFVIAALIVLIGTLLWPIYMPFVAWELRRRRSL